jgi:hypothetical protein
MNENINQSSVMMHRISKIEVEGLQLFETFASRKIVITQEQDGVKVITEFLLFGDRNKTENLTPIFK